MSVYKISSLGDVFFFCVGSPLERLSSEAERNTVLVKNDTDHDYELILRENDGVHISDVLYAFSIFMARLRGFPPGEYDIKIGKSVRRIELPSNTENIFVNHDKCKILFANRAFDEFNPELKLCGVRTAQGVYIALLCDNADNFNLSSAVPRLCALSGRMGNACGLLVLSEKEGAYRLCSASFADLSPIRDSTAAAAAYLFLAGEASCDITIVHNDARIGCKRRGTCISLRDEAPMAIRII